MKHKQEDNFHGYPLIWWKWIKRWSQSVTQESDFLITYIYSLLYVLPHLQDDRESYAGLPNAWPLSSSRASAVCSNGRDTSGRYSCRCRTCTARASYGHTQATACKRDIVPCFLLSSYSRDVSSSPPSFSPPQSSSSPQNRFCIRLSPSYLPW